MKQFILGCFFLFVFQIGFTQNPIVNSNVAVPIGDSSEKTDGEIYNFAGIELVPEFPGGAQAFYKYVGNTFRMPVEKDFKGGKVIASFVIEKDGSITSVKIIRHPGFGTDEETKRVLLNSPKWKPGIQRGKEVRVMYTLPITLQSN